MAFEIIQNVRSGEVCVQEADGQSYTIHKINGGVIELNHVQIIDLFNILEFVLRKHIK